MDLFTLALVSHVDTAPTNMNLFTFVGVDDVNAACKGNVDKWLAVRIHVLGRRLGAFSLVVIICVNVIVGRGVDIASRFPI